jgi:cardiolipin synthase
MHAGSPWRDGNRVRLLENGEQFFARAFQAISAARREILLETFILFEDRVGTELHRLLVEAARRGVRVEVTVDGYGSPRFSQEFLASLAEAGVRFRVFDPHRTLFGMRLHVFRRLHRKLLVIDAERAFVGGINYSADHLGDFGPKSKQDYAIELEGPVVADVHGFATAAIDGHAESWRHRAVKGARNAHPGDAMVLFDIRDNAARTSNIERHYRSAIRGARHEIIIANAYFFPGYGFLRELKRAAQRGVRVSLIVQGEPDMPIAMSAARVLYRELMTTGVDIHEYCARAFHGKVALVDDEWATVGSSNLDPLSLSLNLEANVFVRDRDFNQELRRRLQDLTQRHCRRVDIDDLPQRSVWRRISQPVLYHALRHFPAWAGLLPAHTPKVVLLAPCADDKA